MADLGDEIAALGYALGNLDQARGSLRADAEAVAASLVEQLPTDLDPLVTMANVPIRLADQLDARVTSRHSFASKARWYWVNYAICEIIWWIARPSGRRQLCPEPVATLVREPYGTTPTRLSWWTSGGAGRTARSSMLRPGQSCSTPGRLAGRRGFAARVGTTWRQMRSSGHSQSKHPSSRRRSLPRWPTWLQPNTGQSKEEGRSTRGRRR